MSSMIVVRLDLSALTLYSLVILKKNDKTMKYIKTILLFFFIIT